MIIGYARVSTKGQEEYGNSLDMQEQLLREAGAVEVVKEAYTGKTVNRPAFDGLMARLAKGDELVVCKLDRFARSTSEGIETIQKLLDKGVSVRVLNMGLIDNTPTGKLIITVLFAFAEFERDLIIQRTAEGKAIAKANGTLKEGRPKITLTSHMQAQLEKFKRGEATASETAEAMGVSRRTVFNMVGRSA